METERTKAPLIASLVALVGISVAGCARPAVSAEGERTVSYGPPSARTVINQPVGPVPGVGDIAPVANPLGDDRTALEEGRRLFVQYNCSGCHGGRAGGGMGPSLRDSDWRYGSTPDRIFNSIAQGRGFGMPSWGALVPEQQIWELTAYVSSLRTPREPEAPR
jgi:mono/diheme cytochrome c family protein